MWDGFTGPCASHPLTLGTRSEAGCPDQSEFCFLPDSGATSHTHCITVLVGRRVSAEAATTVLLSHILSIISVSTILTLWLRFGRTSENMLSQNQSTWIKADLDKQKKEHLNHPFSLHAGITPMNVFVSILLDILGFLFLLFCGGFFTKIKWKIKYIAFL